MLLNFWYNTEGYMGGGEQWGCVKAIITIATMYAKMSYSREFLEWTHCTKGKKPTACSILLPETAKFYSKSIFSNLRKDLVWLLIIIDRYKP